MEEDRHLPKDVLEARLNWYARRPDLIPPPWLLPAMGRRLQEDPMFRDFHYGYDKVYLDKVRREKAKAKEDAEKLATMGVAIVQESDGEPEPGEQLGKSDFVD